MKARRHLWWALGGIFLLSCVGFVSATYRFGWSTTGFLDKSLWDWLQLLIVPLVLAFGALGFQLATTRTESHIAQQRYEQDQKIALDKQQEDLLQAYLDRIAELLLEKKLGASASKEVRQIARVRTITPNRCCRHELCFPTYWLHLYLFTGSRAHVYSTYWECSELGKC